MSLNTFLEFWQTAVDSADPARRLYEAYTEAASDLEATRAETLKFIAPVKNSKGVWLVGFASDKVDEIAALSSTIQEKTDKLQSISHAIESFLEITGGKPDIVEIIKRRDEAKGVIGKAAQAAQAARQAATNRNPKATMQELASDPRVVEAEEALSKVKLEQEPLIAALNSKLTDIHKIIDKY